MTEGKRCDRFPPVASPNVRAVCRTWPSGGCQTEAHQRRWGGGDGDGVCGNGGQRRQLPHRGVIPRIERDQGRPTPRSTAVFPAVSAPPVPPIWPIAIPDHPRLLLPPPDRDHLARLDPSGFLLHHGFPQPGPSHDPGPQPQHEVHHVLSEACRRARPSCHTTPTQVRASPVHHSST